MVPDVPLLLAMPLPAAPRVEWLLPSPPWWTQRELRRSVFGRNPCLGKCWPCSAITHYEQWQQWLQLCCQQTANVDLNSIGFSEFCPRYLSQIGSSPSPSTALSHLVSLAAHLYGPSTPEVTVNGRTSDLMKWFVDDQWEAKEAWRNYSTKGHCSNCIVLGNEGTLGITVDLDPFFWCR